MLIRAIRAENFMRFSRLCIEGLPGEGMIGIEGPNESGKSTVGEVLLFAFFGRTRHLVDAPVVNLIRWGAESLSVEVEFSICPSCSGGPDSTPPAGAEGGGPREDFLVFRQIDRYGTNYVKIIRLPERGEVASGNIQVAEFLARRVGFDAGEFQQSFYHDQYELRRVETAQVAFFEAATGVRHLQEAVDRIRREIEPLEREFAYYQKEIARNSSQMEKHDRNAVKLADLVPRLEKTEELVAESSRGADELRARSEGLRGDAQGMEQRIAALRRLEETPIEELPRFAGPLLEAEESAARRRNSHGGEGEIPAVSKALRENLEGLSRFTARVGEVRVLVRDVVQKLSARRDDPATGALVRLEKLEKTVEEEERQVRLHVRQWVPALIATLVLLPYAAWHVLARINGTGWSPAVDRQLAMAPAWLARQAPWALSALAALVATWFLVRLAGSSRHRRRLKVARQGAAAAFDEAAVLRRDLSGFEALLRFAGPGDAGKLVQAAIAIGEPAIESRAREVLSAFPDLAKGEMGSALLAGAVQKGQELRSLLSAEASRLSKQSQEQDAAQKKLQGEKNRLVSEIRECQSQVAKREALAEKNRELEASAGSVRSEIDLRILACGLLEETVTSLRGKMGPSLTQFVKCALPPLTSGRYRDVRVENSLEIKVFSSDKNDFLSLHELSGGTNEALSLALRLAISQSLVLARMRQCQFVLLDEPFKMMDPDRCLETLKVLRCLSPDLKQFLVIQPHFREAERGSFDFIIHTSREDTVLEVACGR